MKSRFNAMRARSSAPTSTTVVVLPAVLLGLPCPSNFTRRVLVVVTPPTLLFVRSVCWNDGRRRSNDDDGVDAAVDEADAARTRRCSDVIGRVGAGMSSCVRDCGDVAAMVVHDCGGSSSLWLDVNDVFSMLTLLW